ncbi:hypothetical protein AURDEDRAFT_174752 [Auricularia subglabra TFB-10046 SS5]|uniref:Uncharacterized protein n=1 Tax=Auricularia subglabra (strain TFB-10046 / SS5) TaxID=717982 RepID=J0CY46_AURST|nr:hypothetical protein AURDEDRAFT_174752 [Auricularia subglabra TFB-10046 SS5]
MPQELDEELLVTLFVMYMIPDVLRVAASLVGVEGLTMIAFEALDNSTAETGEMWSIAVTMEEDAKKALESAQNDLKAADAIIIARAQPASPSSSRQTTSEGHRSLSYLTFPAATQFFTPRHYQPVATSSTAPTSPKKSRSSPNLSQLLRRPGASDSGGGLAMDNDSDDELDAPVSFQPKQAVRHRNASHSARAPPARLPTARIHPSSRTDAPPRALDFIYGASEALAVIPAFLGTIYLGTQALSVRPNLYPTTLDYVVAALWAILTGYQCLCLASGLLTRWRAYYSPLPTLVRLLGLQSICWPATHATLVIVGGGKRPVVCWALIGSTTCVSRAIQLWVVSNLEPGQSQRRWDWGLVGVKCGLPAAILYFVTAWASLLQREWLGC